MIFDSHAHYDDKAFDDDREEILGSYLKESGVFAVVNAGVSIESSRKSIYLAEKYPYIFASVGIHPEHASEFNFADLEVLKDLSKNERVVAIGEIGLDYHYEGYDKDKQRELFEKQVIIANELSLPVVIHDREAHVDTLDILKKYKPKGVVHCFSGSFEMAEEIIKLGMFLGIGGVVTFKNAKKLVKVVEKVSLDSILLETDAPYLAPEPFRGKRCDSSYIKFIAEKIASIKEEPFDEILQKTKLNAVKLFGLEGVF